MTHKKNTLLILLAMLIVTVNWAPTPTDGPLATLGRGLISPAIAEQHDDHDRKEDKDHNGNHEKEHDWDHKEEHDWDHEEHDWDHEEEQEGWEQEFAGFFRMFELFERVGDFTNNPKRAGMLALFIIKDDIDMEMDEKAEILESLLEQTEAIELRNATRLVLKDVYIELDDHKKAMKTLYDMVLENDKAVKHHRYD